LWSWLQRAAHAIADHACVGEAGRVVGLWTFWVLVVARGGLAPVNCSAPRPRQEAIEMVVPRERACMHTRSLLHTPLFVALSINESVARTVPNCTEPDAVQKCTETAPHWYTSGTVRSTSFALLPAGDLRPRGTPPNSAFSLKSATRDSNP
jgi:hypothetical protein